MGKEITEKEDVQAMELMIGVCMGIVLFSNYFIPNKVSFILGMVISIYWILSKVCICYLQGEMGTLKDEIKIPLKCFVCFLLLAIIKFFVGYS